MRSGKHAPLIFFLGSFSSNCKLLEIQFLDKKSPPGSGHWSIIIQQDLSATALSSLTIPRGRLSLPVEIVHNYHDWQPLKGLPSIHLSSHPSWLPWFSLGRKFHCSIALCEVLHFVFLNLPTFCFIEQSWALESERKNVLAPCVTECIILLLSIMLCCTFFFSKLNPKCINLSSQRHGCPFWNLSDYETCAISSVFLPPSNSNVLYNEHFWVISSSTPT